jgi:hypothetical protein
VQLAGQGHSHCQDSLSERIVVSCLSPQSRSGIPLTERQPMYRTAVGDGHRLGSAGEELAFAEQALRWTPNRSHVKALLSPIRGESATPDSCSLRSRFVCARIRSVRRRIVATAPNRAWPKRGADLCYAGPEIILYLSHFFLRAWPDPNCSPQETLII